MSPRHSGVAKLWLLNLFGNAALFAAVYFWLLLPDAHGWQVAVSALLALIIIFFGFWLRTGSFAYFRIGHFREGARVWRAFRHALGHIPALIVWVIPFAAVEWGLVSLRHYTPQFGVWFWQKSPSFLRWGTPRQLFHAADWLLLAVVGLLAAVWLPTGITVAAAGLRRKPITRSLRVLKRPAYWLSCCAFALVGLYLPLRLVWWIPNLSTLTRQAWSAGLRFAIAYLLLISAWIALLLAVGSRVEKEDADQGGSTGL